MCFAILFENATNQIQFKILIKLNANFSANSEVSFYLLQFKFLKLINTVVHELLQPVDEHTPTCMHFDTQWKHVGDFTSDLDHIS